jgi:hypothetical protein
MNAIEAFIEELRRRPAIAALQIDQSFENLQAAATMAAGAEKNAATGDFIAGGMQGAAAIASLFTPAPA